MRSVGRLLATAIGPLSGVTGLLGWFGIGPSSLVAWVEAHLLLTFLIAVFANAAAIWTYRSSLPGVSAAPGISLTAQSANAPVATQEPPTAPVQTERKGCLTLQANAGCFSAQVTLLGIVLLVASFVVLRETLPGLDVSPDDDGESTSAVIAVPTISGQTTRVPQPTPTPGRPVGDADEDVDEDVSDEEEGEEGGGSGGNAQPPPPVEATLMPVPVRPNATPVAVTPRPRPSPVAEQPSATADARALIRPAAFP